MPIQIVRNDITKMKVDAIVNAANRSLLGGGGVDGCIHRAAGPALLAECRTLGGCDTGKAKVTGAGKLPCRYVIHAVGPVWHGGKHGEPALLASCYRTSLELALEKGCESVAFPLISSGIYGYPKDQALDVATKAISAFLESHDMTVYLVIFDRAAYQISAKLFSDISVYIDQHYVDQHTEPPSVRMDRWNQLEMDAAPFFPMDAESAPAPTFDFSRAKAAPPMAAPAAPMAPATLEDALEKLDDGFSQSLLHLIDQKGLSDVQCYKRANIDRKLFSKIKSNPGYRPSKPTVLAFAVALELNLEETEALLKSAGFALSRASKFDIIVEFFISQGACDIFTINEALFAFDQVLLGG